MKISIVLTLCVASLFCAVTAQECVPENQRVDCHPDPDASEDACLARGCLWCQAEVGIPWCHVPPTWGYHIEGIPRPTPVGFRVTLTKSGTGSYFGDDAQTLFADFEYQSDYRLRVKITDGTDRFEVPLAINPPAGSSDNLEYNVVMYDSPVFSFQVVRKATDTVIFDSSLGGLTFSDQFIQIAMKLPSTNAYGFGENEQFSFRHNFTRYETYPMYARDQPPVGTANMYGTHPYYTVVENDGNAHSVMILNSNAQEVVVTPAPGYVYRTIGGLLDIYIFLGPTPENVQQQFTEAIGRQAIPPYWGLGFQLCRWGYDNIETMKATVDRTAMRRIPHDIQYGDIDIMERRLDFTYDKENFAGLPQYIAELKSKGIKFIPILDPGISFAETAGSYPPHQLGDQMDVWIKRADGTPVVGAVWPGDVYFPDFSRNSTNAWWKNLIVEYKSLIDFDAIWIDMNEVASWGKGDIQQGCRQNKWNYPPYVPAIINGELFDATICPDHEQDYGINYDTHSLYGWSQSKSTLEGMREALNGKRGVVLSRSTFIGSGNWAAHWLGDNFSNWANLYHSIIGLLSFNLFGMPYAGADICGFNDDSNEELCTRWQQLGAFYPFARNHNARDRPEQDPAVWSPESAESSRKALEIRYTLLPFLYTLFYKHRIQGDTVVRAFWHEFPTDSIALGVDRQFLWGSGLAITPVLEPGVTEVTGYFPNARWFDYHTGAELAVRGDYTTLSAPFDFINIHVRGGIIIPTQEPAINTEISRENPLGLIIAVDDDKMAKGVLYYDDGDSVEPQASMQYFSAEYNYIDGSFTNVITNNGYAGMSSKVLGSLRLLGAGTVSQVLVNGQPHESFTTLPSGEVQVTELNMPMQNLFAITFV